jgi:hypothetical protein
VDRPAVANPSRADLGLSALEAKFDRFSHEQKDDGNKRKKTTDGEQEDGEERMQLL